MDKEIREWLEQQYQEFERQFLTHEKFWRAPIQDLKGTSLFALFEKFKASFPDHPDDLNTVCYLTETVNLAPAHNSVLLWCSHFEHTCLEDLRNLVSFLEEAGRVLSTSEESFAVEMLDSYKEWIVLRFYSAREDIIELLKGRSAPGPRPN